MNHSTARGGAGMATAVAIAAIAAFGASCTNGKLPSELKNFPADLNNREVAASGIYPDGWAAQTASANLNQPSGAQVVSVRGMIPQIGDGRFRTEIALFVDRQEIGRRQFGIGEFALSAPVRRQPGKHEVSVLFSAVQQLPGGDGRAVSGQFRFLGFESAASAPHTAASDIVAGSDIRLGSGWGDLETFANERFRWVDNDAQILINAPQSGDAGMTLTIEAGPGVGGKCLLKVLDGTGRRVGASAVNGRATVKVFVPVEAGRSNEFRLHVDGGGKPAPNESRILNFRVFRIESTASPK